MAIGIDSGRVARLTGVSASTTVIPQPNDAPCRDLHITRQGVFEGFSVAQRSSISTDLSVKSPLASATLASFGVSGGRPLTRPRAAMVTEHSREAAH